MAIGILGTNGTLLKNLNDYLFLGELSLDGSLRPIKERFVPPWPHNRRSIRNLVLPQENAREAAVVKGISVYGLKTLPQVLELMNQTGQFEPLRVDPHSLLAEALAYSVDFRDVKGSCRQAGSGSGHGEADTTSC
jgi:magnesium chelatase family protein